jgi:hypothetical protein
LNIRNNNSILGRLCIYIANQDCKTDQAIHFYYLYKHFRKTIQETAQVYFQDIFRIALNFYQIQLLNKFKCQNLFNVTSYQVITMLF